MDPNNPYAPPKSPVEAGLRDSAPTAATVPLYSVGQITLAAFLGSLVAAAWLGAANFKAIGQPLKAHRTLWWGTVMTLAVVGVSFLLPEKFPSSVIPLATILLARGQAIRYFETALREHEKAGAELRSWWRVVGISLLILAILFVVGTLIVAAYYLLTGKGLE
jgi:hypothetical protein